MIINNIKGQNMGSTYTILLVLIILALFSNYFIEWGGDVVTNPDLNINQRSLIYVASIDGFQIDNVSSSERFYTEGNETGNNVKDFAIEYQDYRQKGAQIRTMVQKLWNLPTFFISWLPLESDNWTYAFFIWNVTCWVLVFYAIMRLIRRGE